MLEACDVSFSYGEEPVLQGVSFSVTPGELVALVGGNGSGKSTLGRLLAGALLPETGSVVCEGFDSSEPDSRPEVRRMVGLVVQNPADQLVSTVVADEVGFGPQNLGLSAFEVGVRVDAALEAVGLAGYGTREVNALSGGEQQRLALAGVLAMEPAYLVLDEALSMVDSAERPQLRALVRRLARERGIGVVMVTHDPIEALGADRVVVLKEGRVSWSGEPDTLVRNERELLERVLMTGPYERALCTAVDEGYRLASGVEPADFAAWLAGEGRGACDAVCSCLRGVETGDARDRRAADGVQTAAAPLLSANGLSVGYGGRAVLRDVSLALEAGTVTLMAGESGAGKSTLATVLAGLAEPLAGSVSYAGEGRPGLVFQQPENQLFLESVEAELAFGPRQLGCDEAEVRRRVGEAAEALGLDGELLARDPFSLSGGQSRRVALGCVLTLDASAVILDEPTSGLDAASRRSLHKVVRDLAHAGRAVLVISHDLEEWLGVADRVVLVAGGTLSWQGSVAELAGDPGAFGRAGLVAPEAWELARRLAATAGCPTSDGRAEPTVADVPSRAAASIAASEAQRARAASGAASAQKPSEGAESASSPLAGVDARVKLVLLFCAILALFITQKPLAFVVWVVIALALGRLGGMGVGRLVRALRPAAVLLCFIVAANLISCDGSAAIELAGPVGINTAGAARAAAAVARIALMVVFSLVVTATTTPIAVADAFVRLARPLARLRVPVDEIGLVLSLALRFIPLVMDELNRVRLAQRSRGVRFDEGGIAVRIRVWGTVLVPVMVGLFRRADRLGAAMDARCYHEGARRPHEPHPLTDRDRALLIMGLIIIVDLALAGR